MRWVGIGPASGARRVGRFSESIAGFLVVHWYRLTVVQYVVYNY